MNLPESYFSDLAYGLLRFSIVLGTLTGLYFLTRRWISREWVAGAFRWIMLTLVYVFVAAFVLNAFMSQWGFRGAGAAYGFDAMLSHTAWRPYAYRVLTPAVINAASALIPERITDTRRPFLMEKSPLLRYKGPNEPWSVERSKKWHLTYFYLFASLLGILFAARILTKDICDVTPPFADFAPAIAMLCLPSTFHFGGYMYDFPELLLMLLCLIALAKARLVWFYPLFLLAILNKESNVLISAFFLAFMYDRLPRKQLIIHLAVQLMVGALIVLALRIAFSDNVGAQAHYWLPVNALFWLSFKAYWFFITPYAPLIPVPRGGNLISLFLVTFMVLWAWKEKPAAVKRLVLLSAICNLPLFFFFAFLDEIRNLSIMFPAIYLVGCHTVHDVYSRLGRT
jgi:hypothetical protein